jgi:hypothetical protein
MTDKNEMIEHIEELIGSEGSRAQAEAMFDLLNAKRLHDEAGYLTFDARAGFELAQVPEDEWLALLVVTDNVVEDAAPRFSVDMHSRYTGPCR